MNKMNQEQDNEIDFLELLQTLWDGKWLISSFVAIAVLLGVGFLSQKDTVYESKLIYSIDTIPPFYDARKASSDFYKKFYSVSVFDEWKQNNSNTALVFEDFRLTKVVDGFVVLKNENEQFAKFGSDKTLGSFVLVKSNKLPILNDFFEYASHINGMIKDEYVVRAKEELKIVKARFKDFDKADSSIVNNFLSVDRYIALAEKGANILLIQRPTMPKKISPRSSLILAMSIVLGGMVGVFIILVRKSIAKSKE